MFNFSYSLFVSTCHAKCGPSKNWSPGPLLATKTGLPGPLLVMGVHFWQLKVDLGGAVLVAKSGPWGPLFTRATFSMTVQHPILKTVHGWILQLLASGVDATSRHTLMSESSTLMLCPTDKPA